MAAFAFFDFDGTIVSSNVVHQYLWYARRHPSAVQRLWRVGRAVALAPAWKAADLKSRALFNELFYREYQGMTREWLVERAADLFEDFFRPRVFPGVPSLLERNRADGFENILVTGSLDFAMAPLVRQLGFDAVLANRLEFTGGVATGRLEPPVLAGPSKAEAVRGLCSDRGIPASQCRAYSDDCSDLPLLEAVGYPVAANPDASLRKVASQRGWPVLNLR